MVDITNASELNEGKISEPLLEGSVLVRFANSFC